MSQLDLEGSGELFFRSQFDRYRFIELVFEAERAGRKEQQIAEDSQTNYIQPYHISRIQNLTRTLRDSRHVIYAEQLMQVLGWGLEMPRWKVDTLLLLFDGNSLEPRQVGRYVPHDPQAAAHSYSTENLRAMTLRLFDEVLSWHLQQEGPVSTLVNTYTAQPSRWLDADRRLAKIEKNQGMRLFVTAAPSSLMRPVSESYETWAKHEREEWSKVGSPAPSDDQLHEQFELTIERRKTFVRNLQENGETAIYSFDEVERRARDVSRKEEVSYLVDLLKNNEKFQLGLAESTPSFEFEIKSLDWAMMRGSGELDQRPTWGVRYIEWMAPGYDDWDDETKRPRRRPSPIVLQFVRQFWQKFYEIAPEKRDKDHVIGTLKRWADL